MLLSRELGEDTEDYWRVESKAQHHILQALCGMTDVAVKDIHIGVDGCGVPVYGVPINAIAKAFLRLACPELIGDTQLADAVRRNMECIHTNPRVLDGEKGPCACMSGSGDLIAKAGALGVYAFGCRSGRFGGVVKLSDGNDTKAAFCAVGVLEQMGYADKDMFTALHAIVPSEIFNDNRFLVGSQRVLDLGLPTV